MTLVGSATLLLRSYYNLTIVDRGFDPGGVMTFHVAAGWSEDRYQGRTAADAAAVRAQ